MNSTRTMIMVHVALVITALAMTSLLALQVWRDHQHAIESAETETRNYAAILEAQLSGSLRQIDALLKRLEHDLPQEALARDASEIGRAHV